MRRIRRTDFMTGEVDFDALSRKVTESNGALEAPPPEPTDEREVHFAFLRYDRQ